MNNHPTYGIIEYNIWRPVYFHKMNKKTKQHEFGEHPNYEILFKNDINEPFVIRNKIRKKNISSCHGLFTLSNNGKTAKYSDIHIAVASAFPDVSPKFTVDHINNNPNDNRITNLMWMDQSENCKKGQQKSVEQSNQKGGRNGKYVIMKKPNSQDKTNRDISVVIGMFKNIDKCALFILENIIQKDAKPKLKTVSAKIRRAINTPHLKAYGYYYDAFEIKIENEEWKSHKLYQQYKFSTHGRMRNSQGIISRQIRMRNGAKYSMVSVENSKKYIHRLIWETWVGEIPDNMDIMHDDKAPLNSDGSYRNWLCDLSIGKRSENMKSFHNNKTFNNEIMKTQTFQELIPDTNLLHKSRHFPNNPLGDLMRNSPLGIQYIKSKNRGSKYTLSRLYSTQGCDISSTGKKNVTDEEKFIEVLKLYQKYCIKDKQNDKYMNVKIDEFTKYIPESNKT